MLAIFATAIFLGAGLLFLVQPIAAKVLLPSVGGGPAVWNTCMLFFQAALLGGYAYAHLLAKLRSRSMQVAVHVLLVALAGWWTLPTPVRVGEPGSGTSPQWWLLGTLAMMVGPAYVMVAATGPLVQQWFSQSGHGRARDPYFLYVASNAGSMLGLAAYPFAIEPWLTRAQQSGAWAWGYLGLAVLVVGAGAAMLAGARRAGGEATPITITPEHATSPASHTGGWWWWVVLAMVPSALLMGVTQHIATDVASIPLVWIVPLLLYLLTFVLAFRSGASSRISAATWGRIYPLGLVMLAVTVVALAQKPMLVLVGIHLAVFFIAAMMCHTRLADARPPAVGGGLTRYYLAISVGGVLGSLLCAMVAPLVFSSVAEYPLALAAACLLRPQWREEWRGRASLVQGVGCAMALGAIVLGLERVQPALTQQCTALAGSRERGEMVVRLIVVGLPCAGLAFLLLGKGAARFAGGVLGVLVGSVVFGVGVGGGGRVLERERTFFGVHRVVRTADGAWRALLHGTTQHGLQSVDPARHGLATTYYSSSGPLGEVFRMLRRRGDLPISAGFIGLGAGTAASYASYGDHFVFYEIDPAVARIAQDQRWFTFLGDARARARIDVTIGDGRLAIAREPAGSFDLVVVDAFSSDTIPVHLITKEAMELYLRALNEHGVVAFHISSRSFDLAPVVARIGKELGLVVRVQDDMAVTANVDSNGKSGSTWAVIARRKEDLGNLARMGMWMEREVDMHTPVWSDDRANPLGALAGW